MLLLSAGVSLTPIVIALVASGGGTGFIVALIKLRGDTGVQAVSQAQGAMETMETLLEGVERERDYWRERFEKCHHDKSDLLAQIRTLEQQLHTEGTQ